MNITYEALGQHSAAHRDEWLATFGTDVLLVGERDVPLADATAAELSAELSAMASETLSDDGVSALLAEYGVSHDHDGITFGSVLGLRAAIGVLVFASSCIDGDDAAAWRLADRLQLSDDGCDYVTMLADVLTLAIHAAG